MIELVFENEPIAQNRPRFFQPKRSSRVIVYDSQSSLKTKAKYAAGRQMRQKGYQKFTESDGPLFAYITNYVPIPESYSQKKRNALNGIDCIKKPDIDNYIKFILDVLNGIAYEDDRQISRVSSEKLYSLSPCVKVSIWPVNGSCCVCKAA